MAYLDICAGINVTAASSLLQQYFANPPDINPITGFFQQNVENIGTVGLNWNFVTIPDLKFGSPSEQDWDDALDSSGQTNGAAGNPLPDASIIQAEWSRFNALYTVNSGQPTTGQDDIVVYAKATTTSGQLTLSVVAILFKNQGFKNWNSTIFNTVLLPWTFQCAGVILQPIQFPPFFCPGIALEPSWGTHVSGQHLLGATMLRAGHPGTNKPDFSDFTPPSDPVFYLIDADSTLSDMGDELARRLNGFPIGGPVAYQDLANIVVNGKTVLGRVDTYDGPTEMTGEVYVGGNAIINVTDKGLGYGGTGGGGNGGDFCPLVVFGWKWDPFKPGKLAPDTRPETNAANSNLPFTYDFDTHVANGAAMEIRVKVNDSALTLTARNCDTPAFAFTLDQDSANKTILGDLQSKVIDPCLKLINSTYASDVPDAVDGTFVNVMLNKDLSVGASHRLSASKLALHNTSDYVQITCTLSLTAI